MLLACLLAALQVPALEEPRSLQLQEAALPDWRVGARLDVSTAWGNPANDITGGGVYVSYRLKDLINEHWWATLQGYQGVFDFENPGDEVLGTSSTPTADAKITMTEVTLGIEWHPLDPRSRFDFYLAGGLGVVSLGDGDARSLPQVDVEVTGGSGFGLYVAAGAAFQVVGPVWITAELRLRGIFADMDVRDRLTGEEDTLSRWDALGAVLGVEWRF